MCRADASRLCAHRASREPFGYVTSTSLSAAVLTPRRADGYGGRTIALSLENYYAEVTLVGREESSVLFVAHPEHDPQSFSSLEAFANRVHRNGFYGGQRLLWSLVAEFHGYHAKRGSSLPPIGFSLAYQTNIPKQAGLSGSSAILTAALSCLEAHFGNAFAIPLHTRPNLVLQAESALGIAAGLQDRVIQSYEGLMYMDFASVATRGHGEYTRLDSTLLPRLWLILNDNPGDSGAVHSTVRRRWDAGDEETHRLMKEVAELPLGGREALQQGDTRALAALMERNYELRRALFGDAALGSANLRMVEVARKVGAACKFTGSGGAAVALCWEGEAQEEALRMACEKEGLRCELVRVHEPCAANAPES